MSHGLSWDRLNPSTRLLKKFTMFVLVSMQGYGFVEYSTPTQAIKAFGELDVQFKKAYTEQADRRYKLRTAARFPKSTATTPAKAAAPEAAAAAAVVEGAEPAGSAEEKAAAAAAAPVEDASAAEPAAAVTETAAEPDATMAEATETAAVAEVDAAAVNGAVVVAAAGEAAAATPTKDDGSAMSKIQRAEMTNTRRICDIYSRNLYLANLPMVGDGTGGRRVLAAVPCVRCPPSIIPCSCLLVPTAPQLVAMTHASHRATCALAPFSKTSPSQRVHDHSLHAEL